MSIFAFMLQTKRMRTYGRTELASLYFPSMSPESAWRKLRGWIYLCAPLRERLRAMGYVRSRRTFTPAEVAEIFRYLGEP